MADGSNYEIALFRDHDIFGELSFLDNSSRSANAIAVEKTVLIGITTDNYQAFSKKNSDAAFVLLKNIMLETQHRIRRTNDRYSYHLVWGNAMKDALAKNYDELLRSNVELSMSRNFLYNVIGNSSEIIIVLDRYENVMIFNSGAESNLKTSAQSMSGSKIRDFFDNDEYESLFGRMRADGEIKNIEVVLKTFDNKKIITIFSGFLLRDIENNDVINGIVIIARNVTSQKMLEKQMFQNEKMIILGKTASEIVHDIKNPMTIIQLASDCLKMQIDDALTGHLNVKEAYGCVDKIQESVGRIQKIISNTLDFAKVVPAEHEIVNIYDVVEKSIALCKVHKKSKNIDFIFTHQMQNLPVTGNYSQLEQVFVNLITNSIQAISDKIRGVVEVKILKKLESGCEITLSDNGCGISAENLNSIFDPFFTTKGANEGTGLGLSICQAIILQHNGTILCESEVGKGTKFIINLPCMEE